MTTVYVLTWAVDHEGETLMGVYDTHEQAEAAGQAWLDEYDYRELSDSEQFVIYPIVIGAAADMQF